MVRVQVVATPLEDVNNIDILYTCFYIIKLFTVIVVVCWQLNSSVIGKD